MTRTTEFSPSVPGRGRRPWVDRGDEERVGTLEEKCSASSRCAGLPTIGACLRFRLRRHLGTLLGTQPSVAGRIAGLAKTAEKALPPGQVHGSPEFTPRQYAIVLLHIAAAIEHSLLVQYLYAAYSLGGAQVPPEHRLAVAQWQETILGIAKEEMGHLMTVQNLLRCLGGALSLDRDDYPGDNDFYPFRFTAVSGTAARSGTRSSAPNRPPSAVEGHQER